MLCQVFSCREVAQQASEAKQKILAAARSLATPHDIELMKNLLAAYLQGSRWAKTVELRRQLAQRSRQRDK